MKKYAGVLARVREMEQKNGIRYAKPEGKLYKTLKWLYGIIGVWALITNLMYILGVWLVNSGTDKMSKVSNSLITVSVCSLLIIAGFVLNRYKQYIIGAVLSVVPSILLVPVFAVMMKDSLGFLGYKLSFYWRHAVPLILMVIFMVWLTVIAIRATVKTDKAYKRVTENLFNLYNLNGENGSEISEEQWQEFLEKYNPSDYKNKIIKLEE